MQGWLMRFTWGMLVVAGLNMGLVGLFDLDLIHQVFGYWPWLARLISVLAGVAAIIELLIVFRSRRLLERLANLV